MLILYIYIYVFYNKYILNILNIKFLNYLFNLFYIVFNIFFFLFNLSELYLLSKMRKTYFFALFLFNFIILQFFFIITSSPNITFLEYFLFYIVFNIFFFLFNLYELYSLSKIIKIYFFVLFLFNFIIFQFFFIIMSSSLEYLSYCLLRFKNSLNNLIKKYLIIWNILYILYILLSDIFFKRNVYKYKFLFLCKRYYLKIKIIFSVMLRKLDENAYKFVLYIYLKCLKCLKAYKIIFLKLHNKVNRITLDKIKTKFSSFYFNTIRNIKVIKLYFIVTFYKYKLKVKSRFGYMYKFIFILYLKLKLLHYIFYLIIVGFMNVVEYLIYLKKKIAKKVKKGQNKGFS